MGFLSEFQYLQQFPPHQLSLLSNPFPSFGDGVSIVFLWVFGILGCVHGMRMHSVFGLQLAPPQLAPLSSLFPSFGVFVM